MENIKEDLYSDIRPYNDDEIPAALERIVNDPAFVPAVNFAFPDADMERIREVVRTCTTVEQLQQRVMISIIQRIIETTIDNFTSSGVEHIEKDKGYLYISNHRDITLDSYLLQYTLFKSGFPTTATTLGDNLLRSQFIIDICRINRAVRVIRRTDEITPREFLQNSQHLAEYIRWYISQGKSMWIAQRNGRTKDGIDSTDQGVLKMLSLSGEGSFVEKFSDLSLTPIAISYQYEPCDIKKAIETTVTLMGGTYQKGKNEDVNSILYGIRMPKGDVDITICEPITREELEECGALPKAEAYKRLKDIVDQRIYKNYKLHDTNYIAHDILHREKRYAEFYTPAAVKKFKGRMAYAEARFLEYGLDVKAARKVYLGIYANPVDTKL
ncbi:MAG: 1-acyl-sn-glycerol-3-phosphate acyltransferase [Alistipes sp.]|nr:1-acyl-sn-glycerol-3-phosphate acyltransferase [Alistipes sp.]